MTNDIPQSNVDHYADIRRIYEAQHRQIADDPGSGRRFGGMFSARYFGLGEDWFKGKRALDVGCGNILNLSSALFGMGVEHVVACDLGEDFIAPAQEVAKFLNLPLDRLEFHKGDVRAMPFESGNFDFVGAHGVLIHLENKTDLKSALSEFARVTRPGGYFYATFGIGSGLFSDVIIPALRRHYE